MMYMYILFLHYRIRTHVVKFMEGVILTLSRKTPVCIEILKDRIEF